MLLFKILSLLSEENCRSRSLGVAGSFLSLSRRPREITLYKDKLIWAHGCGSITEWPFGPIAFLLIREQERQKRLGSHSPFFRHASVTERPSAKAYQLYHSLGTKPITHDLLGDSQDTTYGIRHCFYYFLFSLLTSYSSYFPKASLSSQSPSIPGSLVLWTLSRCNHPALWTSPNGQTASPSHSISREIFGYKLAIAVH